MDFSFCKLFKNFFCKKFTFALVILLFITCASPKEDLIQAFTAKYTSIIESKSVDFSSLLSDESHAYIDKLIHTDNSSVDEILEVGNTYKVPYSTILYFTQLNNAKKKNTADNFLTYLSANGINIFSYYDIYGVSKKNTKTAGENFIAVFREVNGINKLDWVKMIKDGDGYKIDLLFLLQHAEHRSLKDFQDGIKRNFNGEINKYLEDVFNRDGTTLMNDAERDELHRKRKESFITEFVVK